MNALLVNSPGLLTTVQDLGREGFGVLGVSASGAADPVALRIGNRLVGNDEHAAALEMTLLGGEFQFSDAVVVAVTGSDFGASIDGTSLPLYAAVQVRPAQSIKFGPTRSGARCYLCVAGGIDVPEFLGSHSTHLLSGLGGFEGRALRKSDRVPIGKPRSGFAALRISQKAQKQLQPTKTLRVTQGPQWSLFPETAGRKFFEQSYSVTEEANRMGIRLKGKEQALPSSGEMITAGVSLGAIQVPSGGQPIILFVEQQTTGGYPILANVIAADLASLGQLRPRDEIRFELVTFKEARELLIERERILSSQELIEG